MPYKIIKKKPLAKEICLMEFEAQDIASSAKAGQFVIIRTDEEGERFPLTLYDWDNKNGTITVVFQTVGVSTMKLCAKKIGSYVQDIVGPLGHAANTNNIGKVICIGGGVGTAEAYPIAKAMARSGNDVTVIIGARTKSLVICENEIREFCDKLYITTDDGTYGQKGFVTDILKQLTSAIKYDLIYAIGPIGMMKKVVAVAKEKEIKTLVSLNSIMIDGTGMCGGCRVQYKNELKFTCVDGPEFDGALVDFADLERRQNRYRDKEKEALEYYEEKCKIGLKRKGRFTSS